MNEQVREGFDVFLHDGADAVGAVRAVRENAIVVYIEDGGDFEVPMGAVVETGDQKIVLDAAQLDPRMLDAIRLRRRDEDPKLMG
jgi:hypothetical protein